MTRVLLVEDSPTQAIHLQMRLEAEGLEVAVAGTLAAALAHLEEHELDIILLDLILPDVTGLDGLGRLLEASPESPIVVLSGVSDSEIAVSAVKEGAEDYLIKSDQSGELLGRTIRYAIERHRVKRELADKNAALEALNEEKNQFLGMAAHDLRNPLGVSLLYSKFLLEKQSEGLTERQRTFISTIKTNAEFMLQLIEDLLDVSTIEAGKLALKCEPTDLVALVRKITDLNSVLAERKDIRLVFEKHADSLEASIDPAKLEQVLNNLLSNAIKFSHRDTSIEVEVRLAGVFAELSVRDHGQGIPPDELDRLFHPFETTSVQSTGGEKSTGLGLAIVRKIVSGHGGAIQVTSEVDKGTNFVITLPLGGDVASG